MAIHRITFKSKEEWRGGRKYIGGSDAAAVIGMNPWKDNIQLWEEKTRRVVPEDISEKEFVKYGVAAEPLIRQLFALDHPQYEVEYYGDNLITNDAYPFGAASLDGELIEKETGKRGILEIKTTNILSSMSKEKWRDKIPDNYYCQCLHYLLITEYQFVVLVAQLKSEFNGEVYKQTKHFRIDRSEVEEDIAYLKEQEEKFWKYVESDTKPPLVLPNI